MRIHLDKTIKVLSFAEDGIVFDDGSKITDYHYQDCCEHVYADWKQLEDTGIKNREFDYIEIEGVKNSGFKLNGYFVPCYNEQNGYYADNLELQIQPNNGECITMDVSKYVEDKIY